MTYRERREARADRLEEWAAKRAARAAAEYERARELGSIIPLGQPILIGHHSEGRDRRYRARISATYDRAFQNGGKATAMASRAENIRDQAAGAIYDDDPDAIDRLREKLAELEAKRDQIKAQNKAARAGRGELLPAYVLQNLGGNITRTRQRLARIEARQARTGSTAKPARLLALRYAGKCSGCSVALEAGTMAYYDRSERAVTCRSCQEGENQ